MTSPAGGHKGEGKIPHFFHQVRDLVTGKTQEKGQESVSKASHIASGKLGKTKGSNAISAFVEREALTPSGKDVDAHSPKMAPGLGAVRPSEDPAQQLEGAVKQLKTKKQALQMKEMQFNKLNNEIKIEYTKHATHMRGFMGRGEDDAEVLEEKENYESQQKSRTKAKNDLQPQIKQLRQEVEDLEATIEELRKQVPESDD